MLTIHIVIDAHTVASLWRRMWASLSTTTRTGALLRGAMPMFLMIGVSLVMKFLH